MNSKEEKPSTSTCTRPSAYLMVAVSATAANLALWATGVQHTIATGMLVGVACAGAVCWRLSLGEERVKDHIQSIANDMWWHGYATCLEDTAGDGVARTVVPFRPTARGDKISDTGRRVNGSELR